jgi:hypothetical protein
MKAQKITPKAGCPHCHGTGMVYDIVDYGSTTARLPSFYECVEDQADEDTDEIELVEDASQV